MHQPFEDEPAAEAHLSAPWRRLPPEVIDLLLTARSAAVNLAERCDNLLDLEYSREVEWLLLATHRFIAALWAVRRPTGA